MQVSSMQSSSLSQQEHLRLAFIAAWLMCSLFYFAQYALRSAPGVMLDDLGGQFAVGPLVNSVLPWQQFWFLSAVILLFVAAGMLLVTPARHVYEAASGAPRAPLYTMLVPFKTVLANPQSWLCGVIGGLLFLPTTIFDMIWGVPFLHEGLHVEVRQAIARASMVPLGWVVGSPLLGYVADRIGRRKPVIIGGALLLGLAFAALLFLPPGTFPPYVLGLAMGIGSGAAMIPYSVIKEVNPDKVKGSATGAMNCLVFSMTAFLNPVFGRFLTARVPDRATIGLQQYQEGGGVLIAGVVLAIVLTLFLRETGTKASVHPPS